MKKIRPVVVVFFAGLLLGAVIPCIISDTAMKMNSVSDLALLQRYLQKGVENWDYFQYLLHYRGCGYLLGAIFGISIFGIPMCVLWMGAMGAYVGAVLSSSLITGGLWGFTAGVGMLLPQYLLYVPVSLILFDNIWRMSVKCWKNQHITLKQYKIYGIRLILLLSMILLGFFMESFINPALLKLLLTRMNFF